MGKYKLIETGDYSLKIQTPEGDLITPKKALEKLGKKYQETINELREKVDFCLKEIENKTSP
jgi:hypothetical protein